jgi:hypothetical protein
MQSLTFTLSTTAACLFMASVAWAEPVLSSEEQFTHDAELCTEHANAVALDGDGDGDAKAVFYKCMMEKGHSEDALDKIGEEQ